MILQVEEKQWKQTQHSRNLLQVSDLCLLLEFYSGDCLLRWVTSLKRTVTQRLCTPWTLTSQISMPKVFCSTSTAGPVCFHHLSLLAFARSFTFHSRRGTSISGKMIFSVVIYCGTFKYYFYFLNICSTCSWQKVLQENIPKKLRKKKCI